ncbi:MAG: transporter [Bacteroidales bacterium]|nr:transporter [Bacteroidales bacterium]
MHKIRPYVLPIAIVLGLLFHTWCGLVRFIVPYLVFSILLLNFAAVDVKKLRFSKMDVWLMLYQIVVSIGMYYLLTALNVNEIVAQGILVGVLCPVAASVVVISCMLGANRETVTSYTIMGNLMVAVMAPIYFSFIGLHQEMSFWTSFLMIFKKIGTVIALPFFVALIGQKFMPKVNDFFCRIKGLSFYLWAMALTITLGQTIDFMFLKGKENLSAIIWLGIASVIFCAIQFGLGKFIGYKYGDIIAGGQLLGQKNSAMGIWMANTYLNPLASIFPAMYSIWQNLFNSIQMWWHEKKLGVSS